jgi:hypothetical protein
MVLLDSLRFVQTSADGTPAGSVDRDNVVIDHVAVFA